MPQPLMPPPMMARSKIRFNRGFPRALANSLQAIPLAVRLNHNTGESNSKEVLEIDLWPILKRTSDQPH
jgi:hypothetical protein